MSHTALLVRARDSQVSPEPLLRLARAGVPVCESAVVSDAEGPAPGTRVPEQAVRDQLARIVRSDPFVRSERLNRFLKFTIGAALSGRADDLKEYVIGTQVYDRRTGYATSADSIVRTEARRLRAKLDQYYASTGRCDPVVISFPPGSYAPRIGLRSSRTELPPAAANRRGDLLVAGAGVTVAVLPFTDLSGTARSEAATKAITDELAYWLARTDGFRFVGATTACRPAGGPLENPPVAREPRADFVYDGTVREEGNGLRITCRAFRADGAQIWSHRFDCESDAHPAFALAEWVSSAVISRTQAEFSPVRHMRVSPAPSLLALYPTVLAAESLMDDGQVAGLRTAATRLEELIGFAPQYPRPYWGVAQCYCELAHQGVPLSTADVARARDAAAMGVEIDAEATRGHAALAGIQAMDWDWDAAGRSYQRAMALGVHAGACRRYGLFLIARGRPDQGWHHLDAAQRIDPFSHAQKTAMAQGFHHSRRPGEAVRQFARPVRFGPLPLAAEMFVALSHLQLGAHSVALAMAATARTGIGTAPADMALRAEVLALGGDVAAAQRVVEEYGLARAGAAINSYRRSLLLLALGDDQAALTALGTACAGRESEIIWLAVEPRFDRVRTDPRFAAALVQFGLRPG